MKSMKTTRRVECFGALVLVAVSAVVVVVKSQETAQNPGFRAILTNKSLHYVHDRGLFILKEWLCNYDIPPLNTTSQIGLANVTYLLDNIDIHSLDYGESSLTSDQRGVVLNINDVAFSFSTNFNITETDWPYFTDSGSAEASASGISMVFSVGLQGNGSNVTDLDRNSNFYLYLNSCDFNIANVNLVFKGGASYFYNLFGPALGDIVRYELNRKLCHWLNKTIKGEVNNEYLSKIPSMVKVADGVEIDYSLVGDANFSTIGRVVTDNKGEFLLKGVDDIPTFEAGPLPDPSSFPESSMAHIVISTYVADSAAFAFWKAGSLAYNITSDHLWIFSETDAWCASTLVPQSLCDKYPNKKVRLVLEVVDRPLMTVTNQHAALRANTTVAMYLPELKETAFTLTFTAKGDVTPEFKNKENRLCGTVGNASVTRVELTQSNIGNFNLTGFKDIINNALLPLAVVYVNTKYTQPGFPIPTREGFTFTNSTINYGEDCIILSTDFDYTPTFLPKNTTCTYS